MHTALECLKTKLLIERSVDNAVTCAIEEMSEVTKILCKYQRKSSKFNTEHLTEEIAHAVLMLETVAKHFGLDPYKMEEYQADVIERCFAQVMPSE